jgi:hypothetical protein
MPTELSRLLNWVKLNKRILPELELVGSADVMEWEIFSRYSPQDWKLTFAFPEMCIQTRRVVSVTNACPGVCSQRRDFKVSKWKAQKQKIIGVAFWRDILVVVFMLNFLSPLYILCPLFRFFFLSQSLSVSFRYLFLSVFLHLPLLAPFLPFYLFVYISVSLFLPPFLPFPFSCLVLFSFYFFLYLFSSLRLPFSVFCLSLVPVLYFYVLSFVFSFFILSSPC